ncbi:hypothetical protein R9C00_11590 [Flammeovirgaceae bacterium SG7u.111]|nr:hypothetical protein [Flammeovirgaceae bacterium SG7u.132]WPO38095.1 hypothetical protein R9C00_11590 [Flammeovirgaceae bacterium SG7u.111]
MASVLGFHADFLRIFLVCGKAAARFVAKPMQPRWGNHAERGKLKEVNRSSFTGDYSADSYKYSFGFDVHNHIPTRKNGQPQRLWKGKVK